MRIRTQLQIAAAAAVVVAVIVVGSMGYVAQRSAVNLRLESASQEIARAVANLLTLTQEFTLYGSERAAEQWRARHARLRETTEQAIAREARPHPALLEMRERVLELQPLFERLEGVVLDPMDPLGPRRRELLVERLVSETQEMVDLRHRWATAIVERQARDLVVSSAIATGAGVTLLLLIGSLLVLVQRRGLRPLVRLQLAADAIRRGDLSVRCDTRMADELGDTGRAVNAMADSLLQANAALRQSQERYRLAVDGAQQGIWDWDPVADRLYLSPRAQLLLGREPGEATRPRRAWLDLHPAHPDDREMIRAALSTYWERGEAPLELEYRQRHGDGSWRWFRYRAMAVRGDDGRPTRLAGSMEDISARKEAETERLQLEQQLRQAQKLEAIGTLAGGIAHDFNNILSAILGYGDMVRKETQDGTRMRRHIDAAMSAAQRAKSLVERILAFSRAGMGERVAVPVRPVVGEALDALAPTLQDNVRLQRQLDEVADDAGVLGDAIQLHQVVLNLCANAVHAMPQGGTLTVSLSTMHASEPLALSTRTLPPGSYIVLQVTDTGIGIEPRVMERMFDPFFTTKPVGVGTGLGLSLVHGIVSDLGGGIAVSSAVGKGAAFTVYMPGRRYQGGAGPVDAPVVIGSGQCVAVVDDEEALVRLTEEMLADLGYEPVGFVSAERALEAFRSAPDRFDALLTDESMPSMTGTELALEVQRLRPGVPIVLMSGFVNEALRVRAHATRINEVIAKPITPRELAAGLAAALAASATPSPASPASQGDAGADGLTPD